MLVLDDAGVGRLGVGVVDDGVALIVVGVQRLGLKADAAVLQCAQLVAEVGVHRAGVDDPVGQLVQLCLPGQIVHAQAHFHAVQHLLHHGGIAAARDALIQGVEVVVVVGKTDGQALDDESGQLGAGAAPLLAGVALDELFVDVGADQADGLLLEVLRLRDAGLGALLLDLRLRLGGGHDAPHPVEGVHIEGQVVDLAVIVGDRAVGVAVELRELVDVLPHSLVVGVEDVGAVAVDVDALHLFGVDVACDMSALVDDEAAPAGLLGLMGKYRAVQAGANDKIIVLFHHCLSFFFCSDSDSRPLFFWASRYWSMAVWMRLRTASGVICLSWAAAMV